jgi:mono/diheme cytochrome c family protein
MTRDPVRAERPENALRFPFNIRSLLAFWNLLFLDKSALRQDASQSAQWNRGAYLVDGLAHCGACHTPRNGLGAEEKNNRYLAGGEAEGWYAPALNEQSPSPLPWTLEELKTYLRTGMAERHAIAGGPMQEVVYNLSQAPEEEVAAIATYIHSMMGAALGKTDAERAGRALAGSNPQHPGEPVYAGSCASCHEAGRQLSSAGALRLPMAVALYDPDPRSLIRVILEGITPPEGERGRWMPAFAGALTDEQLVALVDYLRSATGEPPWADVAAEVRKAKNG